MWNDNEDHSGWSFSKMFSSIDFAKLGIRRKADPGADDEPDDDKLTSKLKAMVDALIVANPGMSEQHAMNYLMHSPNGRAVAQHLNLIAKRKEEAVTQHVGIFKLNNIASVVEISKAISNGDAEISEMEFTKMIQGHAMLTKRPGESVGQAFERLLTAPENGELRKAYVATKGMASLEVTSVEVGDTSVSDDSAAAVKKLQEMAASQHRSFEQVFSDPANAKLAAATYTSAHRPTLSSTSGDELQ